MASGRSRGVLGYVFLLLFFMISTNNRLLVQL
jgi:hypothetical protein